MKKDNTMVTVLVVGGVAYAAYWYLTTYGPNGPVATAGGLSYWQQWFGGATTSTGAVATSAPQTTASTTGATVGSPAPSTNYSPKMVVQTASGNPNQMKVGDAYQVVITGAQPNSPVTVVAVPAGGSPINEQLGSTDASGNFTSAGNAPATTPSGASAAGNWTETWAVGGQQAGVWQFTLSDPNAPQTQTSGGGQSGMQGLPTSMSFGGNVQRGRGFQGGFNRGGGRKSTSGMGDIVPSGNYGKDGGYIQ